MARRAALVRAPRRARSRTSTCSRRARCATSAPQLVLALRRGALRRRDARDLPGAARPAARPARAGRRVIAEADDAGPSTTRSPTRRARELLHRDARDAEVAARGRRCAFHWATGGARAAARRRAADRRRAVQLVDRVRRRADPQGVPAPRAGRQPRARDAALPDRARVPEHRPLAGWYEYEGGLMDATLGVVQEYLAGRARRLGAGARRARLDPEALLDAPARARRGHRRDAHRAGLRRHRPGVRARGAERRGACRCSPRRSTRRSSGCSSTCPRRRGARADRRPRRGRPRAPAGCSRTSAPAAGSSAPRRPPPRPDAARRPRLGDPRLRGRAGAPAAERRRKRSPLRDVAGMLRSFAYAASAAELQRGVTAPEGWEERSREAFLEGYFAAVEPSLLPPARRDDASCCRSSSWRRPSTSCATSSTTAPTGSPSRWRGSSGCSRTPNHDATSTRTSTPSSSAPRRPPPRPRRPPLATAA